MTSEHGTSLAARLQQLAHEAPDAPAVTCGGTSLTRAELDRRADALARDLRARGVNQGDYVAIVLPNCPEHVVAAVAAWKLGATPQALSPKLATRELAEILDLTKPAIVIGATDPEVVGTIPALPPDHDPPAPPAAAAPLPDVVSPSWKAPASGGSTGRPKVIRTTQPGIFERVAMFGAVMRMGAGSTTLVTAPLPHNAPFMVTAGTLLVGGHAVVMPRFDAEEALRLIQEHRVTWVLAVPTMMTRISKLAPEVRQGYDVSSVETVFHGAAPCPPEVKDDWLSWLGPDKVLEAYSATEGQVITLISGPEWLTHRGSVGKVLVGEIEIRDDGGAPVKPGEVGRLWMRPPAGGGPTYEYIGGQAVADGDGWETVGDLGWFDEEGYLYLAGRDGDMLLVGGANVYPAEVEAVVLEHPAVLDAAVIGRPHDDLGTVPHVLVHLAGPVDVEELDAFVADRLAPYKRPRSWEVVDRPLRDEAGKLRRSELTAAR